MVGSYSTSKQPKEEIPSPDTKVSQSDLGLLAILVPQESDKLKCTAFPKDSGTLLQYESPIIEISTDFTPPHTLFSRTRSRLSGTAQRKSREYAMHQAKGYCNIDCSVWWNV